MCFVLCFEKDVVTSWMALSVSCSVVFESVPSVTVSSLAGKAKEQPVARSCNSVV